MRSRPGFPTYMVGIPPQSGGLGLLLSLPPPCIRRGAPHGVIFPTPPDLHPDAHAHAPPPTQRTLPSSSLGSTSIHTTDYRANTNNVCKAPEDKQPKLPPACHWSRHLQAPPQRSEDVPTSGTSATHSPFAAHQSVSHLQSPGQARAPSPPLLSREGMCSAGQFGFLRRKPCHLLFSLPMLSI